MSSEKNHLRRCMLYEYQLGHTAAEAIANIRKALSEEIVSLRECVDAGLRSFAVEIWAFWWERTECPETIDSEALLKSVEENPRHSYRKLAENSAATSQLLYDTFMNLAKKECKKRIPHEPSADNKMQRPCNLPSLLSHSKNSTFFSANCHGRWEVGV